MSFLTLDNCSKCGNYFENGKKKCRHCGSRRALNYQLLTVICLLVVIGLIIVLTIRS